MVVTTGLGLFKTIKSKYNELQLLNLFYVLLVNTISFSMVLIYSKFFFRMSCLFFYSYRNSQIPLGSKIPNTKYLQKQLVRIQDFATGRFTVGGLSPINFAIILESYEIDNYSVCTDILVLNVNVNRKAKATLLAL